MKDLVSVIMPNHNSGKYLCSAIESVIRQTYEKWELIIVDDNSTDDSIKIIESYKKLDSRIRLFVNTSNAGAANTRNIALNAASGRWVAFLDSDDIWTDDKLEKQIEFMESGNFAFSCSDYYVIRNNKVINYFQNKKDKYGYRDILTSNSIGCLTVIIDKKQIPKISMPKDAKYREDMACWLDIIKEGHDVFVLSKPLAYYRIHRSVSSNKFKMAFFQWKLYRLHEKLGVFESLKYILIASLKRILKYKYKNISTH